MKKTGLWAIIFFIPFWFYGQEYFRMSADFTGKYTSADGSINLSKGKVYYDKNSKMLIYDLTFPHKEKWILKDTQLIKQKEGEEPKVMEIPNINEFSIFHLALNASLDNFGMENSPYELVKVEKKDGLVISYWKIPANNPQQNVGYIAIAKKNGRLESIVMLNKEQKIISKQFFKDYINKDGFLFPGRIIRITYDDQGRPNYEILEFKNIVLNDVEHNELYEYRPE